MVRTIFALCVPDKPFTTSVYSRGRSNISTNQIAPLQTHLCHAEKFVDT